MSIYGEYWPALKDVMGRIVEKIESFNADKDKKKVIKTNIKYLTRCSKALKDIIDNNTK